MVSDEDFTGRDEDFFLVAGDLGSFELVDLEDFVRGLLTVSVSFVKTIDKIDISESPWSKKGVLTFTISMRSLYTRKQLVGIFRWSYTLFPSH